MRARPLRLRKELLIPKELLTMTEDRAPGIGVYGGAGLKKTHAIHTLPPPILFFDIGEGGSVSVLPWIRRRRDSSTKKWTEYSQELREQASTSLNEKIIHSAIKPQPLIDVVHYDNMRADAYDELIEDLAALIANPQDYNSFALDSLQEFSQQTQSKAKGKGNEEMLMNEITKGWMDTQERAMIQLRRLRNLRDKGIFIYFTASEDIAKDYVKSPMETKKGQAVQEPYSVRGTVNLPGKLAEGLAHLPDILCHARLLNGKAMWVTECDPLPGGVAHWDAKDRFGRLEKYIEPNVRLMCVKLYGQEVAEKIYSLARKEVAV